MSILISLLVMLLIFYLAWWAINKMAVPEPARTVIVVVFAIIAIVWLLQFVGMGLPALRLAR